jgi:hypothetical protein
LDPSLFPANWFHNGIYLCILYTQSGASFQSYDVVFIQKKLDFPSKNVDCNWHIVSAGCNFNHLWLVTPYKNHGFTRLSITKTTLDWLNIYFGSLWHHVFFVILNLVNPQFLLYHLELTPKSYELIVITNYKVWSP